MIQRLQKMRKDEGFTLIELLIVIIILGILAAIVIFGVATFRADSINKACLTDKKNVDTAAAAHFAKAGTEAADMAALVSGNYLRSVPNNTGYTITYAPGGSTTDGVWTVGPASCPT
jgi:general secretion pathway protein G